MNQSFWQFHGVARQKLEFRATKAAGTWKTKIPAKTEPQRSELNILSCFHLETFANF